MDKKYREKGLVIVGFPCNQFGGQEPWEEEKIVEWTKERFGREFDLTEKVNVNGKDAHPLFKFLKKEKGGFLLEAIKWNFTKFLIDREGNVLHRYAPTTSPSQIEADSKFQKAMEQN